MHFYSTLALFYIEPAATCLNSGTFSVRYADGSFTASGSFSSAGPFGEMGTERNGTFAKDEEGEDDDGASAPPPTRPFGDYRVARRPCGRPALSELGVKVSLHPAQALRTPP